jgi:hypothetical protein
MILLYFIIEINDEFKNTFSRNIKEINKMELKLKKIMKLKNLKIIFLSMKLKKMK